MLTLDDFTEWVFPVDPLDPEDPLVPLVVPLGVRNDRFTRPQVSIFTVISPMDETITPGSISVKSRTKAAYSLVLGDAAVRAISMMQCNSSWMAPKTPTITTRPMPRRHIFRGPPKIT